MVNLAAVIAGFRGPEPPRKCVGAFALRICDAFFETISTGFSTKSRGIVREKVVEKFLLTSYSVEVYSPSAFVTGLRKWMRFGETSP